MESLEIFSGIGGLASGLEAAGFRHVDIVESDISCIETLRRNIDIGRIKSVVKHPTARNVCSYDFSAHEGKIALLSGGPPCQPFSFGGSHRAASDPRNMFPQVIRAVREVRPKAFLFENVPGIMRPRFQSYFEYLRLSLTYPDVALPPEKSWEEQLSRLEQHHTSRARSSLEYRVVAQSINAADFGVPQTRQRVFLVGIREDIGKSWNFPLPTHSAAALNKRKISGEYYECHGLCRSKLPASLANDQSLFDVPFDTKPWVTLRDAILDLPDPEQGACPLISGHVFKGGARVYKGHTGSHLDLPSKTLKAGVNGVPGGENMLIRDDGSVRYLTIRECARVQTFPDEFVFHEIWSRAVRQLGNAVPVKLASTIGQSLRRTLSE
ncbi:DNA cytosine methyltransferase [Sulfitobacter sp.]|uniref:DNA cytosine methyltransferase n=1 Tax=Sulfitobacter sp. TaxID=1903071 RepID=UPI003001A265